MGRIVFFSDVHLTTRKEKKSDLFCRFLDTLYDAEALYILGDLFDFWIGPAQIELLECPEVLNKLKALSDAGVQVNILYGNRDFLLGKPEALRLGAKILGDSASITLNDTKVYMTHGDLFCTNDTDYLVLRSIFRFKPLQFAFRFLVPSFLKLLIARAARKSSSEFVKRKAPKTVSIDPKTVRRTFKRGYNVIVCGHIHKLQEILFKCQHCSCRLFILGEWEDKGSFVEYKDGKFQLREFL